MNGIIAGMLYALDHSVRGATFHAERESAKKGPPG